MLVRRLVLVVAGFTLIAGCGGGSEGPADPPGSATAAPSTTPPKELTIDDLTAAMPRVRDVPQGTEVALSCPKDGPDRCGATDEAHQADIAIYVGGGSAIEREMSGDASNFVSVRTELLKTAGSALAQRDRRRTSAQQREGAFDIPPEDVDGVTIPGEKGTGTLADLEIGGWNGYALDQVLAPQKAAGQPVGALVAERVVARDTALVTVTVTLTVAERADDAAKTLVDTVLRDYLDRLG